LSIHRTRGALIAASVLLGPAPALAHAILVRSEPRIGATVAPGAVAMEFRFNSRIDHARSRLTLVRPGRSQSVLAILPEGAEDVLLARADLAPGAYSVRWQVLAVDGHITRGEVPFTVNGR
jgi:methionine-rich copper-binding protein CopC